MKRKKKRKGQNDVVLAHLTATDNWGLTEYRIDNNWKLDDWNDKNEVRWLKWKMLKVRGSVLNFSLYVFIIWYFAFF